MDELKDHSSSEQVWLAKSSGVLMGPYSKSQLVDLLSKKEISIIDEIRSPSSRWTFIREREEFRDVIQLLREQLNAQKDETNTVYVGGQKTITHTERTHIDDLTPAPVSLANVPAHELDKSKAQGMESFPVQERTNKKTYESRPGVLAGLLVVLIALVVYGISSGFLLINKKENRLIGGEDYLRLARLYNSYGNYTRALEFYKKADLAKSLDPLSRLEMLPMLVVLENQYLAVRHILDELEPQFSADKKTLENIKNIQALSYLREGQFDEAEKRYLDLLNAEGGSQENKYKFQMNLLEIKILRGQYEQALAAINSFTTNVSTILPLYKSLVVFRLFSDQQGAVSAELQKNVQNVMTELSVWQKKSQDYLPESYLLLAAFYQKLGSLDLMNQQLQTLLTIYPDLSKEHIHDLLVDREILSWSFLQNICEILIHPMSDNVVKFGLDSYCSYQRGDVKNSLDIIEKSRNQYATDPLLYGLHSFVLYRYGRGDEARVLASLPSAEKSILMKTTIGMVCADKKDWSCAEKNFSQVSQIPIYNTVNIDKGLAQSYYELGKRDQSMKWMQKGLETSSHYGPLLELKEKIINEQ